MNDLNYLSPVISFFSQQYVIIKGHRFGRASWYMAVLMRKWPVLDWSYSKDLCFNPRKIKKIADRKARRAFYQSFSQYKKSFKPRPEPKLKILKNEWPSLEKWQASMLEATKTVAKKFSDMTDAMSYAFRTVENGYWCAWDPAKEV
ncbi:hypothetical protein [Acinetobacter sp.]|uniref:hypothetical protein n=1 Tax=Acinetobacter sp. TaxID=472 RepID=UPI0029086BE9|nr:hypothetical protein [Acinetobacter sp.]MDU5774279.1 hypothetical protein [Acinetobacter sp.]